MSVPSNGLAQNGVTVLSDDQVNTFVQTCQTANQLRGFAGLPGMCVILQGITSPGDTNGGLFYYALGAAYTDNNNTVIVPSGAQGQAAWLRFSIR